MKYVWQHRMIFEGPFFSSKISFLFSNPLVSQRCTSNSTARKRISLILWSDGFRCRSQAPSQAIYGGWKWLWQGSLQGLFSDLGTWREKFRVFRHVEIPSIAARTASPLLVDDNLQAMSALNVWNFKNPKEIFDRLYITKQMGYLRNRDVEERKS